MLVVRQAYHAGHDQWSGRTRSANWSIKSTRSIWQSANTLQWFLCNKVQVWCPVVYTHTLTQSYSSMLEVVQVQWGVLSQPQMGRLPIRQQLPRANLKHRQSLNNYPPTSRHSLSPLVARARAALSIVLIARNTFFCKLTTRNKAGVLLSVVFSFVVFEIAVLNICEHVCL